MIMIDFTINAFAIIAALGFVATIVAAFLSLGVLAAIAFVAAFVAANVALGFATLAD